MAAIPLAIAFIVYIIYAKDAPNPPAAKGLLEYLSVLRIGDAWWFMFFYSVTFGGFSGLASSLTIYFNAEYGLSPVLAGYFTAAAVFAGSLVRPVGGAVADRIGGVRALSIMYVVAAAALVIASVRLPQAWMALIFFIAGMLALGMGNGAVFQLVPQRFRKEIGVMTGLVGMTGGIGGFYLASSLGYSKQFTGSYQFGLLIFAVLAMVALLGLTSIKGRWRTTWGAVHRPVVRWLSNRAISASKKSNFICVVFEGSPCNCSYNSLARSSTTCSASYSARGKSLTGAVLKMTAQDSAAFSVGVCF
jgi:NNP family nitrate/nitrite transporter-like MFS transporter